MTTPIVTLTTDFGLSDHFVGAMKGVILSICPRAQLVDISHGVTPFETAEGAYLIAQAYRYFPKKTVHVVVVDPGVGTSRRPILVEAAGQFFVAPDNGVLAMVYSQQSPWQGGIAPDPEGTPQRPASKKRQHGRSVLPEKVRVRLISNQKYFLKPVSRTFHGRDIFSPVAAHLACGVPSARMGKPIEDYLRPQFEKPQRAGKRTWIGQILKIDRFGNIVTSFHVNEFPDLDRKEFSLSIGPRQIAVMAHNYAECAPGELFLIQGSTGYLEVSVSQGSAAKMIGCETGAPAELIL